MAVKWYNIFYMLQSSEGIKIKGVFKIRSYRAGTHEQVGEEIVSHNLIMQGTNTGFDLILKALNGFSISPPYALGINYGAIGTGQVAPTIADTQLTAEVARTPLSTSQFTAHNEIQMQFFFSDGLLPNQTYYEAGCFVQGLAAANSGQIFDHALFVSPYTKSVGVDTTLELDVSFSQ